MVAAMRDVVRCLLQDAKGYAPAVSDGQTALHFAVENNAPDLVELLLENGADVRAVNKQGLSALAVAVREEKIEISELLLEALRAAKK